jgi:glycogen operon protein
LIQFVERLIRLRGQYAILRRNRFLTGEWNDELGVKDASWLTPTGEEMSAEQWGDGRAKCLGLLLDGRAQVSGIPKRGSDATLLLLVNAHHGVVVFKLPEVPGGRDWSRLLDTNLPDEDEDPEEIARFPFGHRYELTGRSLLLFLLRPQRASRTRPVTDTTAA